MKLRYIAFLFLLLSVNANAQTYQPFGHHFITNYSAKKYKLNPQSFDIVQDNRGIMYFANDGGILEFDGETWRSIKVPTQRTYTIEKSKTGKVYIGAQSDFGTLVASERGETHYESLVKKSKLEKVPTINNLFCAGEWIYFVPDPTLVNDELFAFNEKDGKIYTVKTPGKMIFAGMAEKIPFIQMEDFKIFKLDGRNLIEMGNPKAWNFPIRQVFELNYQLHFFDGTTIYLSDAKFSDPVLKNDIKLEQDGANFKVYKNRLIYSTKKGISVCDLSGNLIFPLNKHSNLIDNNIRELYLDRDNNLWAATENGVSVIDISNTLTYFNFFDGIEGAVEYIGKHEKNMIIETRSGVFSLKERINVGDFGSFDKFTSITNAPYGVTNFQMNGIAKLIIADFAGILQYQGNGNFDRLFECAPWNVQASQKFTDVLLVPDYAEGLILLVNQGGSFNPVRIPQIKGKSGRQVYEDRSGTFWLSEESNGIYRIKPTRKSSTEFDFDVTYFNEKAGLPVGYSFAFDYNGTTYFGTEDGFFEFSNQKFIRSKKFVLSFAKKYTIHRANTDPKGNLWVSAYDVNNIKHYYFGFATEEKGNLIWTHQPFLKVSEEKIDCIYHEDENVTWLGGPEGLFRYDKKDAENFTHKFEILLRKLRIDEDSLIFAGDGKFNTDDVIFSYSDHRFYFEFSSAYYKNEKGVRYSYFLEGADKNWSQPSSINHIELTNLYEGDYVLKVKAMDDYGNSSYEYSLPFSITPPWYRTTFAYVSYGIIFILIIVGAVRISSNGLKKIIAQRTREIEEQKHIVEEKNKEIIDSISYAKRLQTAILPDDKTIQRLFPQSFVLYKPKDIIAGDFFWLEVVDNKILFAVCDCTGHGVPGAMVSIVGANSLNRCVKEFGLTEPAKILDELTRLVEETFSHSESDVKDGMDVSLCCLDPKTGMLQWSGANNPLWIGRKNSAGTIDIEEIKADKQPIGKFDNRKPFTNHSIQLKKDDVIYLFSDGYADQFGGEKGKKFKYSQLKDLIGEFFNLPLQAQKAQFDQKFEVWRGEMEQTDDVCLWTVKI